MMPVMNVLRRNVVKENVGTAAPGCPVERSSTAFPAAEPHPISKVQVRKPEAERGKPAPPRLA
jgi:hypothetical protein